MRRAAPALLLVLALLGAACAGPETPEQEIRAMLARAEAAAEARDVGDVAAFVSAAYRDDAGRDRQAVRGILAYTFMRNPRVHLLTAVPEVSVPSERQASARVLVAMAGHPIEAAEALAGLRADLYRFDLRLAREDDEWRVVSAAWERAEPEDFLPGAAVP